MERKTIGGRIAYKDAGNGEFSGYGSTFGGAPDSQGDIVDAGAFAGSLAEFRRSGFIGWSHNWDEPVAMPIEVKEDVRGLFLRGRFHSTPAAQDARTIVAERLAAGMSYGLSIGFEVLPGGKTTDEQGARHLTNVKLYEVSLVSVAANDRAFVTAAKSAGAAIDDGYIRRATAALATVRPFWVQTMQLNHLGEKDGRVLSAASRTRLTELRQAMADGIAALDQFLIETETDPQKAALFELRRQFQVAQRRMASA